MGKSHVVYSSHTKTYCTWCEIDWIPCPESTHHQVHLHKL